VFAPCLEAVQVKVALKALAGSWIGVLIALATSYAFSTLPDSYEFWAGPGLIVVLATVFAVGAYITRD